MNRFEELNMALGDINATLKVDTDSMMFRRTNVSGYLQSIS